MDYQHIQIGAVVVQAILSIITIFTVFYRPLWRKHVDHKKQEAAAAQESARKLDALKCLLRSEILRIYRSKRRVCSLHQDEYENLSMLYYAYKGLGGNSFVDRIWDEIQEWEITS